MKNASIELDSAGILRAVAYDIQNDGSSPLVAWDVRVEIFSSSTDALPFFAFDITRDTWIGPQVPEIEPGESSHDSANVSSTREAVHHVAETVRYAEFADGVRLGPGVGPVYQDILSRRQTVRQIVQRAYDVSQRNDSSALISWLVRPREQGESFASWSYRQLLGDISKEQGIQAAMQEINRKLRQKM